MDASAPTEAREKAEAVLESASLQFSISGLQALTEFLDEQMADAGTYSLRNNVGILKIYTLYPHIADPIVIQKILLQSLTQLPASDFNICIAQIPLATQEHPVITPVIAMHSMVQNCMFYKFWEASLKPMADNERPFIEVPGLRDSVRRFVLDVVPLVYLQMSVPELRAMLNFESNCEEFEELLRSCKWSLEGYSREDPEAGICVPDARDEILKQQKGPAQLRDVEKYYRTESVRTYYNTLRKAAG
ncbi:SAC3/GANP family protein [Babesia caballi]|uniref:Eukaryotic translation initiation factor 3 subunit K n=1 Tax=Babesia caballi TaxID=5871 RepID=A0AAV4LM36_BABCB|nr:SAC3/GANP family protein [Babesia caballi]